jgi:hypothetical protein
MAQQICFPLLLYGAFSLVRGFHVTNENTPFENNLLRHFTFILD